MPQIQVLPGAPGFGSQLGQALGGGISQGISANLQQMLEQKQQQQKMNSLLSALGIGSQRSQASQSSEDLSATLGKSSATNEAAIPRLTQEQVLAGSIINPALAPALSSLYKTQQKEVEKEQSKEVAQDAFNRMNEIFERGNLGLGSGLAITGKTAEDVGEFETLGGALESLLKDQVSKGTLSNARFKYITERLLPKPTDSSSKIRGKLRGLAKELKLNPPEGLSEKKLDHDTAMQILEQAKGDKEKARKIARSKGYEF